MISFLWIGECPEPFIEFNRRCYGFFVQSYHKTTWYDAQKKCRSFNGGDLISIQTKEENEFITNKTLELNPDLKHKDESGWNIRWVGKQFYFPWIGAYLKNQISSGNYHTAIL